MAFDSPDAVGDISQFSFSSAQHNVFEPMGIVTLGTWRQPKAVRDGDAKGFEMWIDEMRVWKGVRTRNQIKQDIGAVLNVETAGLASLWHFSDGQFDMVFALC